MNALDDNEHPTEWASLLEDDLEAERVQALIGHLDECETCRQRIESLAAADEEWSQVRECLRDELAVSAEACGLDGDLVPLDERHEALAGIVGWLAPTDDPQMLGRLGTYEIVGLIGRGGMGVVLKGLDRSLNRYVAIKVLAPEMAASGPARARFNREARAAAAVVHEHVIAIHSVAEFRGLPYLVMPYMSGQSLDQRLQKSGPLSVVEILRIGRQAALGLAAAHDQGLVHRDVKPANILLERGVERVTLTDFGLARAVDDVALTRTGVIAGTPQYMAPEQAGGEVVDHRADLFSLGSVIYAMCTGRPPFGGNATVSVLRQIMDEEPPPIREINPEIPMWLEDIVGRLHEKRPTDRFQTAHEVAELLAGHLAHLQQPAVVPQPAPLPPRRPRSPASVRRRVVWGASMAALGLILGVFAILTAIRDDSESGRMTSPRFHPSPTSYPPVAEFIRDLDFTPDGRLLAVAHGSGGTTGSVWLWDLSTRKPVTSFPEPTGVAWVALSADGEFVAYGTWEYLIKVRRIETGTEVYRHANPGGGHAAVDFSNDGRWLVIASQVNPDVLLVDAQTWQEQPTRFGGEPFPYVDVRFSPDSMKIVAGGGVFDPDPNPYGRAAVWDVTTGARLTTVGHKHPVMGVDFAPDSQRFATACLDARARIWDVATGAKQHEFLDSTAGMVQVAFSPDGEMLCSLGPKAGAVAWNISNGAMLGRMQAEPQVRALGFSPDGRYIATGGVDCRVRLWDPQTREEITTLLPSTDDPAVLQPVLSMACSPDESVVALGRPDGTILLREIATGTVLKTIAGHADGVAALAFSPDGTTLASGSYDGTIRLWDVATWELRHTLQGHEGWVMSIAFAPDGRTLVSGGDDGTVRLWSLDRHTELSRWQEHTASVRAVAVSPDGRQVVTGSSDRTAVVWDLATGEKLTTFRAHTGAILDATFSPDGETVATAGQDKRIMLWNAANGLNVRSLAEGNEVWCVAFSPDGRWLASGGLQPAVRIWDVPRLEVIQRLTQHSDIVTSAAVLPKSGTLVTAGMDETVKFWKPQAGAGR